MFCPQCGSTQNDELKFCKSCGANLHALRQVMATRDEEKPDTSSNWFADMFESEKDAVSHQAEIERIRGITPEIKRRREIKAGVITSSVGLGLMILLFVLMQGIIAGGSVSEAAAAILSRLWVVGVLPLLVGAALILNGTFVSKRGALTAVDSEATTNELDRSGVEGFLSSADTAQLEAGTPFSVTDETTRHLNDPAKRRS